MTSAHIHHPLEASLDLCSSKLTHCGKRGFGSPTQGWRVRTALISSGILLLVLWTLLPLYWLLFLSLTSPITLLQDPTPLLPLPPTTANFAWLLEPGDGQAAFVRAGYANSLLVATLATLVTLAVVTPAAFVASRRQFRGAAFVHGALLASRAFPPVALAIPFFWIYARLGLLGSQYGLVAAYLGATVPLALWLLISVFAGIPSSVLAAARVDGNTPWQVFWRVAVPTAYPGMVAAAIVSFTGCWNEFALAQFLTGGSSARTFPVAVAPLLSALPNEMAAAMIVGLTPAVALVVACRGVLRSLARIQPEQVEGHQNAG